MRSDSYQQCLHLLFLWLLLAYKKMKRPVTEAQRREPGGSETPCLVLAQAFRALVPPLLYL